MKTKLLFLFLLFSGMFQFTFAFNVNDEITGSSNFFTLDSFTFADDATDITITVNGDTVDSAAHHLFIDTDNNPATGDPDNGGADFRIENTSTNRWDAVSATWVWEWHGGNVLVTNNPNVSVEFKIAKGYIPALSSGSQINVYFTNLDGEFLPVGDRLPSTGMESYTTTTSANLVSLTITEDVTNITMTVLGSVIEPTYDTFIDTDNDAATGYATAGLGADILIQNGSIFDSTSTGFTWDDRSGSGLTSVTDVAGVSRVFVLDRALLGLTASGTTISVAYQNTVAWAATDVLPPVSYTTGTLSINNLLLDNVSIYKTNYSTLTIVSSLQGQSNIKLFNMLGEQVLNSSFILNGEQEIPLPELTTGIYIVRLETELGTLSKKITL